MNNDQQCQGCSGKMGPSGGCGVVLNERICPSKMIGTLRHQVAGADSGESNAMMS